MSDGDEPRDPREALRRYLEQRREMGEREMVLDGMTVEEAMKLVGLAGGPLKRSERKRGQVYAEELERREAEQARRAIEEAERAKAGEGATPAAPSTPAVDAPARTAGAAGADFGGDWRAALRAAGTAPDPRTAAPSPSPSPEAAIPKRKPAEAVTETDSAADRARAARAPRPSGGKDAGMEPSSAPGAAAPSAGRGAAPPAAAGGGDRWALPGIDWPTGLVVGDRETGRVGGLIGQAESLGEIAEMVAQCTRCPLYSTATSPVPGEGNPDADLVCVGEAPGATEDHTGRPFVGASGELLTKILGAIKLRREDVFIANVLKHRPPGNRNPAPDEVVACSPYLVRQLELVQPKVIICWGTFAAQTLLDTKLAIGKLRGQVHRYYGTPLIVTYHPAALLRNPNWKRPTWEDVQLARRILDLGAQR
jgi:DNA polymerase